MACLALLPRRRANSDALEALDGLVRYCRTNAHRMRSALYRESGFPIASLRAALRTAGPLNVYDDIQRARARAGPRAHSWRCGHYRHAREGTRERRRCFAGSSD